MICRLCNSRNLSLFYAQGDQNQYKFYKCHNCGLVNLDLSSIDICINQRKYEQITFEISEDSKHTYRYIKKNIKQRGNLLDIGCGNGSLLYLAKNDGWHVTGIELSESLARQIKKELDIDVLTGNFVDIKNLDSQFDLITIRHVIEHIPDSNLVMQKIHNMLKPNGFAILEFPNIEGISFKFKRFLTKIDLHHKEYDANYKPGHCNEFSKKSFAFSASQNGFKIIKWETYSRTKIGAIWNKLFSIGTKARVLVQKVS